MAAVTTIAQSLRTVSGESTWTGRAGTALFVLSVAGAALAAGSVHTPALCAVATAMAAAAILLWWNAEASRPRAPATLLVVTAGVLTAYTAVQCIPMPATWLRIVAPANADVWARALSPLHEPGPRWTPLSLDPTATRVEVLKGATYLIALLASLKIAHRRAGALFLSEAVIATGIVVALAALLHPALGVHKLYGIWQPTSADVRHIAPLLNPNNLAGYINVAFCLSVALALSSQPRIPRPILVSIALFLAATQIWVASRGGVATMVLGAGIVFALTRVRHPWRDRKGAVFAIVAGLLAFATLVVAIITISDRAAHELSDTGTSKPEQLREAARVLAAFPLWGIGRGAFESAFPAFRDTGGYWTVTHPENFVVQWLAEWGIPIGSAGIIAVAYALRPGAVLVRSSTAAGAWASLVVVTVQNLADLGSEIPGLALAGVVCAGIVAGGSAGRAPAWTIERWASAPRATAWAVLIASAAVIPAAASVVGLELHDDQERLHVAVIDRHAKAAEVTALARETMRRHPSEPYLPFMTGYALAHGREASPLPWLGATLERSRIHGPAHVVLAEWLAPRAPSQARLEYRLAIEQAPELALYVIDRIPPLVGGFEDALELAPAGRSGVRVLRALADAVQGRLPATSVRLEEVVAQRDPGDPDPALHAAAAAIDDLESADPDPWCAGAAHESCVRAALATSEQAARLAPTACAAQILRARALASATGKTAQAAHDLSEAADQVTDRMQCLQAVVAMAERAHDENISAEALGKIVNTACSTDAQCAGNLAWAADVEQRHGNTRRALALYKRARERSPESEVLLQQIAALTARLGLHAEAAADYEELARKFPADPAWAKAAAEQKSAAIRMATDL